MNKQYTIESAVKEFETTSNFLLKSLARLLDTCAKSRDSFSKFVQEEETTTSGFLSHEWRYTLKQDTCKFENQTNGQVLEVNLKRFGEKVTKSCAHFHRFLKTSQHLSHLYRVYNTEQKMELSVGKHLIRKVNRQQFYI